jgi:FKBP-type peptidyl-prolyl cis-trans isomerase FkpA
VVEERNFSGAADLEQPQRPARRAVWLIAGASLLGGAGLVVVAWFAVLAPRGDHAAASPPGPRRLVDTPVTVNVPPPDVTRTLPSGLRIVSELPGSGAPCLADHMCTVSYRGFLYQDGVRGAMFDESAKNGPFTAKPEQVIPGFAEAIKRLRVGGKSTVIIPPALAYGDRGTGGGTIPPGATLLFELELTAVN